MVICRDAIYRVRSRSLPFAPVRSRSLLSVLTQGGRDESRPYIHPKGYRAAVNVPARINPAIDNSPSLMLVLSQNNRETEVGWRVLNDDYELSRLDILELSSRDALAAFFAKLGYATNDRLVQRASAMGFSSDALKAAITHIERIASQEGGLLEVYLVELRSVTVATTRALVNAFRNLSVLFPLLVLTDDYQRLDFVLVERYSSPLNVTPENAPPGLPAAAPQVGVRPRILTVNRQKPGEVELRVLRRFSFTESDTFAQNDKLLSAYDVAEWSEPFFNNRALFSDYYLTTRLPASPQWQDPAETAAMTRAFKQLRQLYASARETCANQPAHIVRTKLLEPTLTALGFTPQPINPPADNTPAPDYQLYAASSQPPVVGYGLGLPPPWSAAAAQDAATFPSRP